MDRKIILGTDCSFRNLGWCICEVKRKNGTKLSIVDKGIEHINSKVIKKQNKSLKDLKDCLLLADKLSEVIDKPYNIPSSVELIWAFEIPVGSQSARAARLLGMTTGIIAGAITELKKYREEFSPTIKLTVRIVKPSEVKNKVGNRKATKHDIMNYINKKYNNIGSDYPNSKFEHIADAIVIAEVALDQEENKSEDSKITM